MGTRVGRWPVDLLAAPDHAIVGRVAILTDTDNRGDEAFTPPAWLRDQDPQLVRGFFSAPTLEPSITLGNEEAVTTALDRIGIELPTATSASMVDEVFRNSGRRRKGEFALELGAELSRRLDADEQVRVPDHFRDMLDYLYAYEEESNADPPPVDD